MPKGQVPCRNPKHPVEYHIAGSEAALECARDLASGTALKVPVPTPPGQSTETALRGDHSSTVMWRNGEAHIRTEYSVPGHLEEDEAYAAAVARIGDESADVFVTQDAEGRPWNATADYLVRTASAEEAVAYADKVWQSDTNIKASGMEEREALAREAASIRVQFGGNRNTVTDIAHRAYDAGWRVGDDDQPRDVQVRQLRDALAEGTVPATDGTIYASPERIRDVLRDGDARYTLHPHPRPEGWPEGVPWHGSEAEARRAAADTHPDRTPETDKIGEVKLLQQVHPQDGVQLTRYANHIVSSGWTPKASFHLPHHEQVALMEQTLRERFPVGRDGVLYASGEETRRVLFEESAVFTGERSTPVTGWEAQSHDHGAAGVNLTAERNREIQKRYGGTLGGLRRTLDRVRGQELRL